MIASKEKMPLLSRIMIMHNDNLFLNLRFQQRGYDSKQGLMARMAINNIETSKHYAYAPLWREQRATLSITIIRISSSSSSSSIGGNCDSLQFHNAELAGKTLAAKYEEETKKQDPMHEVCCRTRTYEWDEEAKQWEICMKETNYE